MEISILIEPTATGFRASTSSPVQLAAEAETEAEAIAAFTVAFQGRLSRGSKILTLTFPQTETTQEITARMRANPLYAEYEQAIEDFRKVANAVPDAD
jgi:hypothetical protein